MSSIREHIMENIKTTLAGVTVANGYANNIKNVQRWDMRGKASVDVPYITIAAGEEGMDPVPYPMFTCRLSVFIDVWIRQIEDDVVKTDTLLSSLVADIKKAMMLDATRGGYAKNTIPKTIIPFEPSEGCPEAGIVVEVEVVYQHRRDNPDANT